MITATFIFRQARRDAAFDELDAAVAHRAEGMAGYLGRKKWSDEDGALAIVYYWETVEALEEFAAVPEHLEAKRRVGEWYAGYRVEIGEIRRVYGDGSFDELPGPTTAPIR